MDQYRRNKDPFWIDCSPDSLKKNAWDNRSTCWNMDVREDVNEWPLQKLFKAMVSLSYHVMNQNKDANALILFDSPIFNTMAERWTSAETGGSIRLVNGRISIVASGIKDTVFQTWLREHQLRIKTNKLQSNTMNNDHHHQRGQAGS